MAGRFEQWMEHNVEGHDIENEGIQEVRLITELEIFDTSELKTAIPYENADEHLKEWIEFLRHCGGFRVC